MITIRPATEADLPEIVEVAVGAFAPETDAMTRNLFPERLQTPGEASQKQWRDWIVSRKTGRLSMKRGVTMVAVEAGQIVGYTVWFRPLREGEEEETPPGPTTVWSGFDYEAWAELRNIMAKDEEETFGKKGARDVWTLDYLGVHPRCQRRGLGRQLLEWGLDKAKSEGKGCYLVATPPGLPLYTSAGFIPMRTLDVFGDVFTSMVWPDQSVADSHSSCG